MLKKKINFNKVRTVVISGRKDKLKAELNNIRTGIIDRTFTQGKDVNLKQFKGYSESYKKSPQKKGKNNVNLWVTGHMLGAISFKSIPGGFRFYFNAKEQRDKASWNQKLRKFFCVDKEQIKYLKKKMSKL